MGALGAENTQLKSNLEESAAIAEGRDTLKAAATTEPPTSPESLAEGLERLRQEKSALEQALQKEREKLPIQA